MSLNETVSAERLHIGFFGMRNAGKSSIVNAVTGQELSVVSDIKGTTTDPVTKAMELKPLGPVVIIDTPGLDDEGELGQKRVEKAKQILAKTDIAVLVIDSTVGMSKQDYELEQLFQSKQLPYVIVFNKAELLEQRELLQDKALYASAITQEGIFELKEKLGTFAAEKKTEKTLVADLLQPDDIVILVTPIDAAAPKGRLILPQQQTIREILDNHCMALVCQDTELPQMLESLKKKPKLVITDSQAFGKVSKDTPEDIMLTSFSILFARYKGDLAELIKGAAKLSCLEDGDKVLISEGCTHHRQCNDIGTVKLPGWIDAFAKAKPQFSFTSGGHFPDELQDFSLIVHCGACMLNEKEMQNRIAKAKSAGVPIVNYGIAIAHMHGILKRSLQPFPEYLAMLDRE